MRKHMTCLSLLLLSLGCSPAKTESKAQISAASGADKKGSASENAEAKPGSEDEAVNPPNQIAGAYMTATILPGDEAANVIKVGIIGMLDDVRLSDEDELYKSSWTIALDPGIPVIVRLSKSTDKDYDQVLEFFGNEEQLAAFGNKIDISLQFQENLNGEIVNRVVVNALSDLVP